MLQCGILCYKDVTYNILQDIESRNFLLQRKGEAISKFITNLICPEKEYKMSADVKLIKDIEQLDGCIITDEYSIYFKGSEAKVSTETDDYVINYGVENIR